MSIWPLLRDWPFRREPPIARVQDPDVRAALADLEARVAALKKAWDALVEIELKLDARVASIEHELTWTADELGRRGFYLPPVRHPPAHTG